jgi:hypothetical protein
MFFTVVHSFPRLFRVLFLAESYLPFFLLKRLRWREAPVLAFFMQQDVLYFPGYKKTKTSRAEGQIMA